MNHHAGRKSSAIEDLEFKEFSLAPGRALLFFPRDLTIIESDESPGIILRALREQGAASEELPAAGGYPPDYVKGLLRNFQELKMQGILGRELREPCVGKLVISRVIVANTLRCNLACTYCYNRFPSNQYHGGSGSDMSADTFAHLISFMRAHRQEKVLQKILFIGGETLLGMDIIRKAVDYRRQYKEEGSDLYLSLTTNGTLLSEEIIDFCTRYGITIKLTIDGDEKTHDSCRVYPDGRGSYKAIALRLPLLMNRYGNPFKFVTTTIDTLAVEPQELLVRFVALGFNQIQLTEKYSEGGRVHEEGRDYTPHYRAVYRDMADFLYHRIRSRLFLFIIPLSEVLQKLSGRVPSFFPCDASMGAMGVGPDGALYPCHHFFGNRHFQVGTVQEGVGSKKKLRPYRIPVTARKPCSECWARFLCGGPCYHRSFAERGDPGMPVERECERKKALYEEMAVLYQRLKKDDSAALAWYLEECRKC